MTLISLALTVGIIGMIRVIERAHTALVHVVTVEEVVVGLDAVEHVLTDAKKRLGSPAAHGKRTKPQPPVRVRGTLAKRLARRSRQGRTNGSCGHLSCVSRGLTEQRHTSLCGQSLHDLEKGIRLDGEALHTFRVVRFQRLGPGYLVVTHLVPFASREGSKGKVHCPRASAGKKETANAKL